jgi:hypothetical protein
LGATTLSRPQGDFLFASSNVTTYFDTFYIGDPSAPVLAGRTTLPSLGYDMAVAGDFAYVACGDYGLRVVDVSLPSLPAVVGSYDTTSPAETVEVVGDHVFLGLHHPEVLVIDVSDPMNPAYAGEYDWGGGVLTSNDIVADGDVLHIVSNDRYVCLDISDPTNPAWLGSATYGGGVMNALVIGGDTAYVACDDNGLMVLDVGDPTAPEVLATAPDAVDHDDVVLAGDHLYVPTGQDLSVYSAFSPDYRTWDLNAVSTYIRTDVYSVAARISTTQTPGVSWYLSSGISWIPFEAGAEYMLLPQQDYGLRWLSMHELTATGGNPTCSELVIDVLTRSAWIESIDDVPGDQGGWVRVEMSRSGHDDADEPLYPISTYYVWRRADDLARTGSARLLADVELVPALRARSLPLELAGAGLPLAEDSGRLFVTAAGGRTDRELPPGTWEVVGSLPGAQMDTYIHPSPTLADSTDEGLHWSVYCVTTHTMEPTLWYTSPSDSGYSIDNLAPNVPTGFAAAYGPVNDLTWDPPVNADFRYFKVYRGDTPDFAVDPENPAHLTIGTSWLDPDGSWGDHYKLSAVDFAGNESAPATLSETTGAPGGATPAALVLYPNTPNPFNPSTTIRFALPTDGRVVAEVYGLDGRRVATLCDDDLSAGPHTLTWDGRDGDGREVSTGVYHCRVKSGATIRARSMVLVR